MNPIDFALRHPITMLMLAVSLVGGGFLAMDRMRMDIFPAVNLPEIYVIQNFNGMSPAQMEGLIVNQFELNFQYVDGVKNVESKSIQQIALIKLSFYPGTDMSQAMAEVVAQANRAQASMPPGVLPPQIMRMDSGSVPVGYLVMTSDSETLGELADLAQQRIRPLLQANVPGTVGTAPFGSNVRSIVVSVDPDRLRSYNLTPDDIVKALTSGNAIAPAGNLYVRDEMPLVPVNAMIEDIQEIGGIPVSPGRNVYIHDVATIADSTDVNFGYALVNGRRSVYIPVVKKNTASTLTVVDEIRRALPVFENSLPESVKIRYEFDESPTVKQAIRSVATEGLIGATLVGLMILLFLHDWQSVLVVVVNIPAALMGSLVGLWLTDNTINIMTLGGLALAIGVLVDEATVEIENIHSQMVHAPTISHAVRWGNAQTAVPRLLAMLCTLSVFMPAFIMTEPMRSFFVPLSLAVGFAMISSYLLSSTLVPVLSVWMLGGRKSKAHEQGRTGHEGPTGLFARIQALFGKIVSRMVQWRWVVVPGYLALCAAVVGLLGPQLGAELFPAVDSGEFVLRFRAPPGTNYELTRQIWVRCLEAVEEEAGAENVLISMGFAGQQAPNFGMNNMILFMRGPDDGQMRVALQEGSGVRLKDLRERLRTALPQKIIPWLAGVLRQQGLSSEEALARAKKLTLGFEPGDIVSEVMSFGSPTPIEVVIASPSLDDARIQAVRVRDEFRKIPSLRDVQIQQTLDYPAAPVTIDRQKAGLSDVTAEQVADSLLVATSSSRMVSRNYWQDPRSGVSYQVQVQAPILRMDSPAQIETLPIEHVTTGLNLMLRDVARVGRGVMPGEYDRTSMQRYLSVTANVEGEDLGRAAKEIDAALDRAGTPPRSVRVMTRGQIAPMRAMFESIAIGLAFAVATILILLTAYFQSWRLALISVGAVPGVLSGVVLMLLISGTSLNIESFMGTIMCVGVSVSNSVMLVTFTARDWQDGRPAKEAAVQGATERLRPILMTASAMVVGMIPMSLALEAGSEMQAPLARAVIGGLLLSTFSALLVIPPIFSLIIGNRKSVSPSLHPDDLPNAEGERQTAQHPATGGSESPAGDKSETQPSADASEPDVQ